MSVAASRGAQEPRGEPGAAARGLAAGRQPLRGAPEVRQVIRPAMEDGRAGSESYQPFTPLQDRTQVKV